MFVAGKDSVLFYYNSRQATIASPALPLPQATFHLNNLVIHSIRKHVVTFRLRLPMVGLTETKLFNLGFFCQ